MSLTKIGSIGINTGIQFAGVTTVSTLHVGSGVTLSSDGDIFATGISTFSDDVKINVDSKKILLGAGADLEVFHNGTNSHLRTQTGNLIIDNNSGGTVNIRPKIGEEGIVCTTDGSTALYHDGTKKFETSSSGATVTGTLAATAVTGDGSGLTNLSTDLVNDTSPQLGGDLQSNGNNIDFADNDKAIFGTGSDLEIFHNGSNSFLDNNTGNLYFRGSGGQLFFRPNNSEDALILKPNGAVELYYDNSKKFETSNTGVSVTGNLDLSADNYKLRLGGGNDIEIYTDGSHSYLNNENGNWYIHGSTGSNGQEILIRPKQAENSIRAIADGAVELYHDSTLILSTASSGVTVQNGNLALNRQDTGNEGGEIVFNRASDNANQWFNDVYGNDSSARIRWHHGGSEKAAFLTGGGITFNGDTATANALDDYEEGTFTPSFGFSNDNFNGSYSFQGGYYTKIGRIVNVSFQLVATKGTGVSGTATIYNLPFTALNADGARASGSVGYFEGFTCDKPIMILIEQNQTQFPLRFGGGVSGATNIHQSHISNSFRIYVTITYHAA